MNRPKIGDTWNNMATMERYVFDGENYLNVELYELGSPAERAWIAYLQHIKQGIPTALMMHYQEKMRGHPLRKKSQAFNNWIAKWLLECSAQERLTKQGEAR